MNSHQANARFEVLWTEFLEGELSADGLADLERLLAEHSTLQARAADLLQTHRLLGFVLREDAASDESFVNAVLNHHASSDAEFTACVMQRVSGSRELGATASRPAWLRSNGVRAALAVLAVLLMLAALWPRAGMLVEIVKAEGDVSEEWKPGQHVRLERLKLVRGNVKLKLPSSVLLDIHAPVEMQFMNSMQVRVLAGKVTADVGAHGKGFVIETPQARVVDLGTRFGVDASAADHTDVVVFSGQVELYQLGEKNRVALLQQGEAIRVEDHRRTSRIVSVSGSEETGGWNTNGRPLVDSVVTAVRDSMSTDDEGAEKWPTMRSYYRIVPSGMRNGALAFSDSMDEWADVPPELVGADQIRTFSVDGFNWWMKLTVELSRPAELFVFIDQRNPVPQWVRESFTDTGQELLLDFKPAQAGGRVAKRLPYSIWRREVGSASVTLGPPYENPPADRKSFSPNRMFGVAVKAHK